MHGRTKSIRACQNIEQTVQHRAEAPVLVKLFQDYGERVSIGHIRPLC